MVEIMVTDASLRPAAQAAHRWHAAATGFILGMLLWLGARELGVRAIPGGASPHLLVLAGVLGSLLALRRARRWLWIAGAAECLALLAISYTPLVPTLMRAWVRGDSLQSAQAVVSLSSDIYPDGTLDEHAQLRVFHAYELLGAGAAPRLVLTRIALPRPSSVPLVRRQMRLLGLRCPIDEVGPTHNTHDEALAVARLFRQRRWKRVILVSDPVHLRRAGAVFAHAGVNVCCSPGPSTGYNVGELAAPGDRLAAFRDWLREWLGYHVYQWRGWI
jgi:uncharacterized SAM-binding protein YcdF (DUF218 family)